ncbi:MAG: tetratricopeptide repeat protein [Desulfobacteraceae bacterium]|nr:tetratricopeptide repeat protein [Desulfobacteraceae bacterium]
MKPNIHKGMFVVAFIFFLLFSACGGTENTGFESKGDLAFKQRSYKKAIVFWQKAIDKYPTNATLYAKVGKAFLKESSIDKAEEFFKHSVQINPEKSDIQKELVRILLIKGDHSGAQKKMKELDDLFDKDANYYILYGDFYVISDNYEKAEHLYRKAIQLSDSGIRADVKLALCLKASKNDREAANIIAKVEKEEITEPFNLLLLSDYYFLSNKFMKAETCILDAVKRHPDSQILNIRLAQFYLQTGMKEKALKTLHLLEESYPDNVRFKLMLADFYLSGMQISQAENMLNKLKTMLDEDSRTNYNLLMGKYFLYKHQIPHAISYLKTATNEKPLLLSARYLLGIAYFAGGRIKLAENSFVNALMLDPYHVDTLVIISYLHYKNQEYDLCLQYLERIFAIENTNSRALMAKGLCLLELGRFDEASPVFLNAFSLGKSVSALYFYGLSIERGGEYKKAVEIFKKVLTIDPVLTDVLKQYSSLLLKLDQTDKAVELAEQILKQHSGNPAFYYVVGDIYFMLEQYEMSQAILETALKEKNPQAQVYSLLAASYLQTGKESRAIDLLKTCTVQNPLYERGWIDLSSLYFKQGKKKMALDTLRTAYKKVPASSTISGNLAWLFLETNTEIYMALDLSRKAYEKNPENAAFADTLGWAYYHKRAYSHAEWMFEQAEKLAPEKGVVKYHKAMLLYKQDRISLAREKFQNALKYDLPNKIVDHIQEILVKLETE